ncbi:MAG: NTP transferase domain-containing protein [Solirubrobacterales bacterium]
MAGGRGSRLGGRKAGAELGGRPLASHPVAALRKAGLEAAVYAKPGQELPELGAPVRCEPAQPRHPLCGIVAALRDCAATRRPLVVVACDLPFVAPALLAALAAAPEPLVVASLGGRPQPLLGRYEPGLLPALEAALAAEEPLTGTVAALGPRLLDERELAAFGDPGRILFNVNDEADLRQARKTLLMGDC